MDRFRNPDYLRALTEAVTDFRDLLKEFVGLHAVNDSFARGLAPAVFPRDDVDPAEIDAAAERVDIAAGRAADAPGLTGCKFHFSGYGDVDPIAAWASMRDPKPLLEPASVISACNQMLGRLASMIDKAVADAAPEVGVASMHPLIWAAARPLWQDGHHREAVAAASEVLIAQVKVRTGRNDVSDTALWQETFSSSNPSPGKPRLRWQGDPTDRDVKSMNDGLRQFAPGAQMTIRNGAVHTTEDFAEQDAVERLAVLSLLARWADTCELVTER